MILFKIDKTGGKIISACNTNIEGDRLRHLTKIEKLKLEEYVIELRIKENLTLIEIEKAIKQNKGLIVSREAVRKFLSRKNIE